MTLWEPDGWSFSESSTKLTTLDNEQDSDEYVLDVLSDDEQLFAKSNILRKKRYKKINQEQLLPE
tara:strand:- start:10853 stop:11047 length:195 start_codon:yes stop_codon:yes gene_type:complete